MFLKKSNLMFFIVIAFFVFFENTGSVLAGCVSGVPTIDVAINPTVSNVKIGTAVTYTVTVTNNDTDDGVLPVCGSKNFNLTIVLDSGLNLTTTFATNPLSVSPGSSANTTFQITSDATGLGLGNYNFTVTASDGTYTESATATYNINLIDVEICDNGGIDDDGNGYSDCADIECLGSPECCGNGNLDNVTGGETCDTDGNLGCTNPALPICANDCSGCLATPDSCPIGWGNCDGNPATGVNGCETDLFNDVINCGSCDNVCKTGSCVNGKCPPLPVGGLVPCGRLADNPSTPWPELQPCKVCHAVILASEIINFLMGLVIFVTILAIIIAGLIHIKAGGDENLILAAKQYMNKILLGFVFVFTIWVIVNTGMVLFGFNDPFGDGSWAKFNCDLGTFEFCGDGTVQNPNSLGEPEECEASETLDDYTARKTAFAAASCSVDPTKCCIDGDGNCPDGCFSDVGTPTDNDCKPVTAVWAIDVSRCNNSCKIACKDDPLEDKIGQGCFIGACQKGRYACDLEGGGVACLDIYSDSKYISSPWYVGTPLYDYCCDSKAGIIANSVPTDNPNEWKIQDINPDPLIVEPLIFTIERSSTRNFYCQDVCAAADGKVCIGVGFSNPTTMSCRYVIHDRGSNCINPGNNAASNCKARFSWRHPNECTDGYAMSFGVRETACYCAF